jgi:hypothetical protein
VADVSGRIESMFSSHGYEFNDTSPWLPSSSILFLKLVSSISFVEPGSVDDGWVLFNDIVFPPPLLRTYGSRGVGLLVLNTPGKMREARGRRVVIEAQTMPMFNSTVDQ